MKKKTLIVTINVPDSEPSNGKVIKEATEKLNKCYSSNDTILFVDSISVKEWCLYNRTDNIYLYLSFAVLLFGAKQYPTQIIGKQRYTIIEQDELKKNSDDLIKLVNYVSI